MALNQFCDETLHVITGVSVTNNICFPSPFRHLFIFHDVPFLNLLLPMLLIMFLYCGNAKKKKFSSPDVTFRFTDEPRVSLIETT